MATLEEITGRFRKAVGEDSGLGHKVKFNLKSDGVVLIDGAQVSNEDAPADLIMTLSLSDLEAMGEKRLDPMMAFMTGRLKVSDMNLAMQLQPKMQALFNRAR
ncbi:MAG: SCP2 sterol-binding domain-containing protein [Caulobacteraceae bacterium]